MPLANDTLSTNAMGGTELMKNELVKRIPADLLENFQIFVSRIHEPINPEKIIIYWLHDLPNDPQAAQELVNGKWKRFDVLVFVSNWQMQMYVKTFGIPYSRCVVMDNAIVPLEQTTKDYSGPIRLIYTPTPHRGLELLLPAYQKLREQFEQVELDVFSSFKLYGWEERDKPYEKLFEELKAQPGVRYHGSQDNATVREALKQAHIFAYPSIWEETSCLCLMEAMSAKTICIHPNYGALPDTSGCLTVQYQFSENATEHLNRFYSVLVSTVEQLIKNPDHVIPTLEFIKMYADGRFSWENRGSAWENLFYGLMATKDQLLASRKPASGMFSATTL